jgi:hypothetical protein
MKTISAAQMEVQQMTVSEHCLFAFFHREFQIEEQ